MEIGERNIHSEDELDQIRKGEGSVGDSNCHYILGLPIEHPMTGWSLHMKALCCLILIDGLIFFTLILYNFLNQCVL